MPKRLDKYSFEAAVLSVVTDPERGYTLAMIWRTIGSRTGLSAGAAEQRLHRSHAHLLPLLVPTAPPLTVCKGCGGTWRQRQGKGLQAKACPTCQSRDRNKAARAGERRPGLRARLEKLLQDWEKHPDSKVSLLGVTDKLRTILED